MLRVGEPMQVVKEDLRQRRPRRRSAVAIGSVNRFFLYAITNSYGLVKLVVVVRYGPCPVEI